jgi:hypothetical protein
VTAKTVITLKATARTAKWHIPVEALPFGLVETVRVANASGEEEHEGITYAINVTKSRSGVADAFGVEIGKEVSLVSGPCADAADIHAPPLSLVYEATGHCFQHRMVSGEDFVSVEFEFSAPLTMVTVEFWGVNAVGQDIDAETWTNCASLPKLLLGYVPTDRRQRHLSMCD